LKAVGATRPALLPTASPWSRNSISTIYETGTRSTRWFQEQGRAMVYRIIYRELCRGEVRPESKTAYRKQIKRLRRAGADSVILGCTEITMLIAPEDTATGVRHEADPCGGGDGFRARVLTKGKAL
jgi:aspartate racemase